MTITPETARAWVDVDLARAGRQRAHPRGAHAAPACCRWSKLTATGWAPSPVARALEPLDPWGFGVATVEEGAALRGARDRPGRSSCSRRCCPTRSTRTSRTTSGPRSAISPRSRLVRPRRTAVPPRDRHRDGARRLPLGRRAGARRPPRRCCATPTGWEGAVHPLPLADTDPASAAVQWERFQEVLAALPRRPAAGARRQQRRGAPGPGLRRRPDPAGHLPVRRRAPARPAPRPVAALRARVVAVRAARRRRHRELRRHLARAAARRRSRRSRSATPTAFPAPRGPAAP